jgi:hypothetical protein
MGVELVLIDGVGGVDPRNDPRIDSPRRACPARLRQIAGCLAGT